MKKFEKKYFSKNGKRIFSPSKNDQSPRNKLILKQV